MPVAERLLRQFAVLGSGCYFRKSLTTETFAASYRTLTESTTTMKHKLLLLTLLSFTNIACGQIDEILEIDDILEMNNLYAKTDSIKALKNPFSISEEFKLKLTELERQHPSQFFEKFYEYINEDKFDESSFLYHLGVIRYSYYNSTNKNFEASGDGALFPSLQYITGEMISIYLKNDIDKYIEILDAVDSYAEKNDYTFHSKNIDLKKYNELKFTELIKNLSDNKNKLKDEWSIEREEMKDYLSTALESYNTRTEEEKKN